MVHIRKLEIYGFKSFGLKNTTLNFDKGLVAVTGPNGSGKSNIMDAILFAMGENSPKALRVDRFQSLFHDSQSTSSGLIRVGLSFDNNDRGIPVDSDSVTIAREMEGKTGDSQYYLNGKKVTRFTIIELLEIVMGASNKLNIVQQGMITRISELNLDERRRIIEDIVGLSYFDEKKAEAIKHLEEADRRLEVAFARIGEIRKRIDELEIERNNQLRYSQLEKEISKFRAIKLSNSLRSIRTGIEDRQKILDSTTMGMSELSLTLSDVQTKLEEINVEKTRFIQEVDAANKAKAKIASKLSNIVYDSERKGALLKETEQRIDYLEKRIPLLKLERDGLAEKIVTNSVNLNNVNNIIVEKTGSLSRLRTELENANYKIDEIVTRLDTIRKNSSILDLKYKRLEKIKNNIEILKLKAEEKIRINEERSKEHLDRVDSLTQDIENIRTILSTRLEKRDSEITILDSQKILQKDLKDLHISDENTISKSLEVLSRAEIITLEYEAQTNIAKDIMNEDTSIAELRPKYYEFEVLGLVHELLSWDKSYERAILAAGSDWMKAFVVKDVKSMISVARYAKSRKLPKLKIIPLEVLSTIKKKSINRKDRHDVTGIIGNLADFVKSDYISLVDFIFGTTFIVRTPTVAYLLAKRGYRVVSVLGDFFEPELTSTCFDFGSKISDLSEAIVLRDSIGVMRQRLSSLDELIKKKSERHVDLKSKLSALEPSIIRSEAKIENINSELAFIQKSYSDAQASLSQLDLNHQTMLTEKDQLFAELEKYQNRLSVINTTTDKIIQRLEHNEINTYNEELAEATYQKNQLIKLIEATDIDLRQQITNSTPLKTGVEKQIERSNTIDEEIRQIEDEISKKNLDVSELRNIVQSIESEIQTCRDQEQQSIDASGTSYTILQKYEARIKTLIESEKKLSKELNTLERDHAINQKDISSLRNENSERTKELADLGYANLLDSFDVDTTIKELTTEYEQIRNTINLKAVESYGEVVYGYRDMSTRRNELETERNSIIRFIEETVKEKREVFMDAFTKVDNNIRKTFSDITGGSARLELENADDISSGILLMVQFPGKNARESTSLSGGEKTMAATIFLLALQSLRPSPFYIMDEVDAHLDAENTERLSKVLLQRSRDNQIIMVTLKDSVVAEANLVYGVYPKSGASQAIKYKHQNRVPEIGIGSNLNSI